MPLDAMFLYALTDELQGAVTGSKIDKVQQPGRDVLILSLRGAGNNVRMLISAGSGSSRVHLTRQTFENPQNPPSFCMLLRKHLVGARIAGMVQPDSERLLDFELDTYSEFGEPQKKHLIVEMMGRSSNVVLTDDSGLIIGCMRPTGFGDEGRRQLLPGLFYKNPPRQNKLPFLQTDFEGFRELWETAEPGVEIDKWLLRCFAGLSPLVCRELCLRCFGDTSPRLPVSTGEESFLNFPEFLQKFADTFEDRDYEPWMLTENGTPRDFSFMRIEQYGGKSELTRYSSFSELLDSFYSKRESRDLTQNRAKALLKSIKNLRDKQTRKLAAQAEELAAASDREQLRKFGELVTANIYRIKKGDLTLRTADFYVEGQPEIVIELDPLKTPQQNAMKFFKDYGKAKNAEEHLTRLIQDGEVRLVYLESVIAEIERAESSAELQEIRRELEDTGILKSQRRKQDTRRPRESQPLRFISSTGFSILAGRNNTQNDTLTFKTAHRNDIWLHAQKYHGSHVIVRCDGTVPDEATIAEAAMIAAFYSQAGGGSKVAVDYTQVRYVKRQRGAMPGMVIYTDYKTLITEADEDAVNKLKI